MSAVIWPERNRFNTPPEGFLTEVAGRVRGRVRRAYVFGSYGTAAFRPGSDVDLILVAETDRPFVERPRLFDDLYDLYPRLDLLVYTPGEFDRLIKEPTGFWASVRESLRAIPLTG
ncbi:MAG: nucleotidyltransferase domain-containing protein [Opitutales bacterium]|nr:nucleotidyltransferase domain-containing protein [Opitutales bacterium]